MTITVAVTGGIGAGKSTVSRVLGECGAVVVDSDRLAREVVAVGTPGLAAIADQFGSEMIAPDGALDRPALAAVVFADPAARRRLEAITHPLVRARFATLQRAAPAGSVVVNDIPLLTTRAAASAFHLVIGVGAPVEFRVQRLVDRGLTADDAVARISAQIDDDARRLLCDVWIDNSTEQVDVRRAAEAVWSRLSTYAANVESGRPAARPGPRLVPYSPAWPEQAGRLMERVHYLVGDHRVDHIGSTAVPGFPAKDVIDLQLTVDDLAQLDEFAPLLTAGGFPLLAGIDHDNPHPDAERAVAARRLAQGPARECRPWSEREPSPQAQGFAGMAVVVALPGLASGETGGQDGLSAGEGAGLRRTCLRHHGGRVRAREGDVPGRCRPGDSSVGRIGRLDTDLNRAMVRPAPVVPRWTLPGGCLGAGPGPRERRTSITVGASA